MSYVAHIPTEALPASGNWKTDATPLALGGSWRVNPGGIARLAVLVTYTRGGAGGYPKLRFVWTHALKGSNGATTQTARSTTNNAVTVSSGSLLIDNLRTELLLKGFSDLASIDTDVVLLDVPPGASHIKVECAEVGNTGAPGTIVVDIGGEV